MAAGIDQLPVRGTSQTNVRVASCHSESTDRAAGCRGRVAHGLSSYALRPKRRLGPALARIGYFRRMRPRLAIRGREGLPPAVIAWRMAHALIAAVFLSSILYIWWCAISRRRGRLLRPAVGALAAEGVLVAANQGNCPLGALGDRVGDPVPLFELVLPPRAARSAVPVLGVVAAAGIALLAARPLARSAYCTPEVRGKVMTGPRTGRPG